MELATGSGSRELLRQYIEGFGRSLFWTTREAARFRDMGHEHFSNEAIAGLLAIPSGNDEHTTLCAPSCVIDLPLRQATFRVHSSNFCPVLLFRCPWPEMREDIGH